MTTPLEHVLTYHDGMKEFWWESICGPETWIYYVDDCPDTMDRLKDLIVHRSGNYAEEEGIYVPRNWEVIVVPNV